MMRLGDEYLKWLTIAATDPAQCVLVSVSVGFPCNYSLADAALWL